MQSTRFPNKVLCDLGGVPMVVRTALNAQKVDNVVVACDDERIESACSAYKIQVIMTDSAHSSGTDRCAEACNKLGLDDNEIVLNIQADEPFLETHVITQLKELMRDKKPFMASLAKVVSKEEIADTNLVKVVLNAHGDAIYFSRLGIPYCRDKECSMQESYPYLGHFGLYGFSARSLREFCSLAKSPLEEIEKLEQLRALYHGKRIAMAVVESESIGIDTQKDYELALKRFL